MDAVLQQALDFLPPRLRTALGGLSEEEQRRCEEIRLRAGRPLCWSGEARERPVLDRGRPVMVEAEELAHTVEIATQASFHTVAEKLRSGFLPLEGGHRLGLCGSGVVRAGELVGFRWLSSLNLRLARQISGIADPLAAALRRGEEMESTLILSPPGGGKTTLLRELIRCLSSGDDALRIGLVDERGEVASLCNGHARLDVGEHTDVMDGCPKARAAMLLLRGMTPQVLAMDEITTPEDIQAILTAVGCGVSLLATAHGAGVGDLERRPLYRPLWEQRVFRRVIRISLWEGQRRYHLETLP